MRSALRKIREEIPLETRIKVATEMAFINLITELGYREDKAWTDDEKEISNKIRSLAVDFTKDLMEDVKNNNCNCDEDSQSEEDYEVVHLSNSTYQVIGKSSKTVWKQGTLEECNDWVML